MGNDFENDLNLKLDLFYKRIFHEILPHLSYSTAASMGSAESIENYECWHSNDSFFKDSPYEYNANDFLHFTNLNSASQILHSGFLRMSTFRYLEDNKEIEFAANVFENTEALIDLNKISPFKEKVFCLSMTEFNEQNIFNSYLWEKYGDFGKGVSIRYKLTKPKPYFYLIGKMMYGENDIWPIKKIKENILKYRNEGKPLPKNMLELMVALFSFHKSGDYSKENEVRLFLNLNNFIGPDLSLETIYEDITFDKSIMRYNKLFLKNRNELANEKNLGKYELNEILNLYPQVEIKEIFLGPSIEKKEIIRYACFFLRLKRKYKYDYSLKHIINSSEIRDLSDNSLDRMCKYQK